MKAVTKEAKQLLQVIGLYAEEQDYKRAYWRNIKYGIVNGWCIANYLRINEIAKPIPTLKWFRNTKPTSSTVYTDLSCLGVSQTS